MANDSSMLNIDMVDQFGKNIANVSAQTLEIFSRLGQQLQTVNSVWNDDNYDNFQDNFEHNIMKKVQEVSAEMELFSDYIKKTIWRRLIMIKPPRMIIMKPIKNQNMSL